MIMPETLEANHEIVRRLYEDRLNPGKLEDLDQVIAGDYIGIYGT